MSFGPLNPLDLSMVLLEIGTLLGPSDLYACALVDRHLHSHFAPFLYWLVLEESNTIAQRLYDTNIARPLRIGDFANVEPEKSFGPNYRLQADLGAYMIALVGKIKRFSSLPTFHRRVPRVLSNVSFISLIILGTLSDNITKIDFLFKRPRTFASPGPDISPEVYTISTEDVQTQKRSDRVMEMIERCTRLECLMLGDYSGYKYRFFRWILSAIAGPWRIVQLPLSTPRWPNLKMVELRSCTLDDLFIRTLFVNSPALKILRLTDVGIRSIPGLSENLGFVDLHPDAHPALEELQIHRPKMYPIWKQMELARLQPKLKTLQLSWGSSLDPEYLSAPGFHSLTNLDVCIDVPITMVPVVQAANRLEYVSIKGKVFVDEALGLAFKRHSWTLTTLVISCDAEPEPLALHPPSPSKSMLNKTQDPLHLILRTCHALKDCTLLIPALNCDPAEFDSPWVCNAMERLIVVPDCRPKDPMPELSSTYTPLEAQHAFYLQLSRLQSLRILGFGGVVGSRSFSPERNLELLCGLDELELLLWHSWNLDSSAQPTVEHAVLVANHWPRLKAIRGLYHYVCRPFVDHVKAHRPDVDLRY